MASLSCSKTMVNIIHISNLCKGVAVHTSGKNYILVGIHYKLANPNIVLAIPHEKALQMFLDDQNKVYVFLCSG